MKIALCQQEIIFENKIKNIEKICEFSEKAKKMGGDIVFFPEMSFTGFSMNLDRIGEPVGQSETVGKMSVLARRYQIAIGFGWAALPQATDRINEKSLGSNRFTLLDGNGEIVTEYSKIHPFTYGGESERYAKGEQIVSVPFLGRNVSLFICYDLRFPELFQIASQESDIIFVIANWPEIRSAHWQTLLRARAIETQSYLVGVNCYGSRDGDSYSGDSMAVDSIGNILGILSGREGVLICDLDDRAWRLRQKFSTRTDRQEELYGEYFSGKRKVADHYFGG